MRTIDVHTHLLSPEVRFKRIYDRVAVRFFARSLGAEPAALLADPYHGFLEAALRSVRESKHVDKLCLYPVDARYDEGGRLTHRDPTVCSATEDVLAVHAEHAEAVLPFLSVNPRRADALDRLDEYAARGCVGAKFLQNYWGLDTGDERFVPYYEKLRDLGLPLTIHVGSEYSIQSDSRYEGLDMLRLPLDVGVTVMAAHMALGRPLRTPFLWRNFSRTHVTSMPTITACWRCWQSGKTCMRISRRCWRRCGPAPCAISAANGRCWTRCCSPPIIRCPSPPCSTATTSPGNGAVNWPASPIPSTAMRPSCWNTSRPTARSTPITARCSAQKDNVNPRLAFRSTVSG